MVVTAICIGDPHFQVTNIQEVDLFIEKITELVKSKKPDICVILGDILHTHERLHTIPLNKAYEFIDNMRRITKTYVLVGNHDMCLGKNVPVLLWNGGVKMSQDIKVGDELIGDDGRKRTVKTTCSGKKEMYQINQETSTSYTVSSDHLLSVLLESKNHLGLKVDLNIDKITELKQYNIHGYFSKCVEWDDVNVDSPYNMGKYYAENTIFKLNKNYIVNSYNNRLEFVRGFLDGSETKRSLSGISVFNDNEDKLDIFQYIIRSLSYACKRIDQHNLLFRLEPFSNIINFFSLGVQEYYGFSVDENNRFLLQDFTVTHNCNNKQHLSENHWMNGMKEWKNTVIVDKVISEIINGEKLVFIPYVYPGRFEEALNTCKEDWRDASVIFAHQEFAGCKMGAIVSVEGDKWPLENPYVISGHIHSRQRPQKNIYYTGSAMQHAFGESEKNIIAHLEIEDKEYILDEIDLELPRKKIVYMDVEDVDAYKAPENVSDKLKVTVSGNYDQFKALKKTKKYKNLVDQGIKVVFKPKKIEQKNKNKQISDAVELQKNDNTDFKTILNNIVISRKNQYLTQTYELVVNGKETDVDDVVFL